MKTNPLKRAVGLGPPIWTDSIRCDPVFSAELRRLIDEDELREVTSNPAIFEKAIAESRDYAADILEPALSQRDAQAAAVQRTIEKWGPSAKGFSPICCACRAWRGGGFLLALTLLRVQRFSTRWLKGRPIQNLKMKGVR